MKRTYSQIDMDERRKIARWRTAGISVDLIAERRSGALSPEPSKFYARTVRE
nr:hypothetical protein [Phyllobacterium zundukense]